MLRETLSPHVDVEGFDHRVVGPFAWAAKVEPDLMRPGPVVQRAARELLFANVADAGALNTASRTDSRTSWLAPRCYLPMC
jgi:hypothetical protein